MAEAGRPNTLIKKLIVPLPFATPSPSPSPSPSVNSATPASPTFVCDHVWELYVAEEATEDMDALMVEKCTNCGQVRAYVRSAGSAFTVFCTNVIEQVEKAVPGATITIDTELWGSFPKKVMEAIAARRDITIELTYRLEGRDYRIVIPAEANVPTDVPYAGFDGYLAGLYGKTEINA